MPSNDVERYLNTLEARMKHLPAARRSDDLREIRSHLETLIAGYRAQGHDDDAAAQMAIRQFGHADELAGEMNRVWLKQVAGGIPALLFIYLMGIAAMFAMYALTGSLDLSANGLRDHLINASVYTVLAIMPAIVLGGHLSKRWQSRKAA